MVVVTTVKKAVTWLNKYILSGKYQPWNAFFSGSVKGFGTYTSEYPYNRHEYFNGTKVPDDGKHHGGPTIKGMEAVVSADWYQQEMKKDGSPVDFHGFNNQGDFFPFWSSVPYTYVTSMLALATYTNIE